jgi:hypothetical protein
MTEISHSEVLQLLGLPVDGADGELATALAGKIGARGPERDDTVRYLVAVVGCLHDALLSRPDYLFDTAEAANSVLGCALSKFDQPDVRGWTADLGLSGPSEDALTRLPGHVRRARARPCGPAADRCPPSSSLYSLP